MMVQKRQGIKEELLGAHSFIQEHERLVTVFLLIDPIGVPRWDKNTDINQGRSEEGWREELVVMVQASDCWRNK